MSRKLRSRRVRGLGLLPLCAVLAACSHAPRAKAEPVASFLEATASGAADPRMTDHAQRLGASFDVAVGAAQRKILSTVQDARLKGGSTLRAAMVGDSRLRLAVEELVHGAEIVETEWTPDDGCVVTIRIPKDRFQRVTGVELE